MTEEQRTPGPFVIGPPSAKRRPTVMGEGGNIWLAEMFGGLEQKEMEANAEYIVMACNCHDELLAACENIDNVVGSLVEGGELGCTGDADIMPMVHGALELVQAAIEAAKARQ